MCFPRGTGPRSWVPQQGQVAQIPRRLWAVIFTWTQLGGSCEPRGWNYSGLVSSASGIYPGSGGGQAARVPPLGSQMQVCVVSPLALTPALGYLPQVAGHATYGTDKGDVLDLPACKVRESLASVAGPGFFLDSLSCHTHPLSVSSQQLNPSRLPRVQPPKLEPQHPAPTHCSERANSLDWKVLISNGLCGEIISILPTEDLLMCSSLRLWSSAHPCQWRGFRVCRDFSSFLASSPRHRSLSQALCLFIFL